MGETFSVLIPDGEVSVALYVAHCLVQSRKVKLHILSSRRWNRCRFFYHRSSYQFRPTMGDNEEYFKAIADLVKRLNIDVILPVSTRGIKFAATRYQALSELAALPSLPSLQSFRTANNKWLLTEISHQHHIPVPRSISVTCDSTFYQQLPSLAYPVLLKPIARQGGRGICQFENPVDVQRFLEAQDEEQFKGKYLVQSYVPGSDLGLSVLCRNGEILAFTIQEGIVAQNFGPLKAMRFVNHEQVLENGRKLVSALGWSGVAHIDMRYDRRDGQVKVLEVNPRYWLSLLGSLVVGVNFPYLNCLEALDIPFPVPEYQLGKYVHTGPAVKEIFLKLVGKSSLDGFSLRETGLRFFFSDPVPEILDWVARGMQYWRKRGIVLEPLEGFLVDWYPMEL